VGSECKASKATRARYPVIIYEGGNKFVSVEYTGQSYNDLVVDMIKLVTNSVNCNRINCQAILQIEEEMGYRGSGFKINSYCSLNILRSKVQG
jgi:hypothetical protein